MHDVRKDKTKGESVDPCNKNEVLYMDDKQKKRWTPGECMKDKKCSEKKSGRVLTMSFDTHPDFLGQYVDMKNLDIDSKFHEWLNGTGKRFGRGGSRTLMPYYGSKKCEYCPKLDHYVQIGRCPYDYKKICKNRKHFENVHHKCYKDKYVEKEEYVKKFCFGLNDIKKNLTKDDIGYLFYRNYFKKKGICSLDMTKKDPNTHDQPNGMWKKDTLSPEEKKLICEYVAKNKIDPTILGEYHHLGKKHLCGCSPAVFANINKEKYFLDLGNKEYKHKTKKG